MTSRFDTLVPHIAVTLTLAIAASSIAVPLFGVLSPFIIDDLGMSRTQWGVLVAATPAVGAVTSPLAGALSDRFTGHTMLYSIFVLCCGMLAVIAAAPAFPLLLMATIGTGVLNAAGNPATNRFIVETLAVGRRGWVTGIKQSGLQVGLLLSGAVLPAVADRAGWRVAVLSMAFIPIAGVTSARLLRRASTARGVARRQRQRIRVTTPARRWLISYAFLMGAVNSVVLGFLPLYAQEDLGFSPVAGGAVAATVGAVGLFARISWGRLAERARRFSLPLGVIALLGVAGSVAVLFAPVLGTAFVWIGGVLLAASLIAWNGAGMLAVISLVPPSHVGTFSGQVQLGFFAGLAVSPIWFGALIDHTGRYAAGWAAITAVAMLALLVAAIWDRRERRAQRNMSPHEIVTA